MPGKSGKRNQTKTNCQMGVQNNAIGEKGWEMWSKQEKKPTIETVMMNRMHCWREKLLPGSRKNNVSENKEELWVVDKHWAEVGCLFG